MRSISGMLFQDGLTGSAVGDRALYPAPPLRAFENELGVQGQVILGDLAGFTAMATLRTSSAVSRRISSTAGFPCWRRLVRRAGDHWEAPWLLVSVHGHHVRKRAERLGGHLQAALGSWAQDKYLDIICYIYI